MNRKIRTIALHEYLTNVKRKEFILMTLGLPIFMLIIGGVSAIGTTVALGSIKQVSRDVGIVDHGRALTAKGLAAAEATGVRAIEYQSEEAAQADVRSGKLLELIVLEADYLDTGHVRDYRKGGGLFSEKDHAPVEDILTRALLTESGADKRIIKRAIDPTGEHGEKVFVLDRKQGFVPRNMGQEAAKFAVPYAFTILLTTSIFIAANYLLRGISDEKENRVIEVILSSVTAEELLLGKLIGLAGVGLTQVGAWVAMAALPAMLTFSAYVHLSVMQLVGVVLFFALGFGLYATLMAGIGALGTSYRESQQMSGAISILAFCPFFVLPVLLEMPNGTIARVFSFIPFTAPGTMVLRISATDVPMLDVVISAVSVIIAIWLLIKLSTKLFRFGLLIYGKRPTFGETVKWLRQA
jgi:ABC-2 type transport system permease protein